MKMNKLQPHTSTWTELTNITMEQNKPERKECKYMIKDDSIYRQAKPNYVLFKSTCL